MKLSGTAAMVTGASRGLGEALAFELAEAGASVVLVARSRSTLEPVLRRIRERGGQAEALEADLGNKSQIHPLAFAAAALFGPIDLLIHNASELGPAPLRLLLDTECEDFERVLAVNLLGPFRLSKILAGSMALRRTGTIVHISSDASVNAYPRWGAYSVSKAALDQLARLWSAELLGHGVRSFSVDPGEMDTQMHAAALPEADRTALLDPEYVARKIVGAIASPDTQGGARLQITAEAAVR